MDAVKDLLGIAGVVLVTVLLVLAVIAYVARRYKVASPSEAFIVVGRKGKAVKNPETGQVTTDLSGQKVVMGGGVFVAPLVQRVHSLSLSSRKITVSIRGAVSKQGIRLNLDAVAIVKVGGTEDSVRAAAQRFLNQQEEIDSFTQEVLAGSLRSIVGTLTVDEIIRDRAAFAAQVASEAVDSLNNQGLVLDTFQIQDVSDDSNYLRDLGRPEAAAAGKNAAIAEANANREAAQRAAEAEALTAEAERNLALQRSSFKAEQDRAAAEADAAGELARAAAQQSVLAEQEQVAVRQAALRERVLDTEVRKPADAERYRTEQEAQGRANSAQFEAQGRATSAQFEAQGRSKSAELDAAGRKAATVADAQAAAERVRLAASAELARRQSDAQAVEAEGLGQAAAIAARGEAEAKAITAKGAADASAVSAQADALAKYGEAAKLQMLVDMLPRLAAELAGPLGSINDLTVISNDGAGALSRSVGTNMQETFEVVRRTTGIDVASLLAGLAAPGAGPSCTPVGTPAVSANGASAFDQG